MLLLLSILQDARDGVSGMLTPNLTSSHSSSYCSSENIILTLPFMK